MDWAEIYNQVMKYSGGNKGITGTIGLSWGDYERIS